jgi:RHH-type rel operon transcriptional repressor/antitoxin RelB
MYYKANGGGNMTISIRLNDKDTLLFKKYAELKGVTVSELVRESVLDRIEDEYDLKAYEKALAAYHKNPVTYSLDEVEKELGLK